MVDHPDVAKSKDAADKFKLITQAYRKIMDERAKETESQDAMRMKYKEYIK